MTTPMFATGAATSIPGSRRIVRYCSREIPPNRPERKFGCTRPVRRSSSVREPRGRTSTS